MRISRISTVALLAAAAGLLAACQPSVDDLVKDQARLAQILEKCTAMGDKAAQDRLCQTANEADAQVKAMAEGSEAAPAVETEQAAPMAEEAPAVADTPAEEMGEQAPAAGGEAAPAVEEGAPAAEENAGEEAPAMGEDAPAAAEGEAAPAEETH